MVKGAQPIQLAGPGPFELPTVVGTLGWVISQASLPAQLRLQAEGGQVLHIPLSQEAIAGLRKALEAVPTED